MADSDKTLKLLIELGVIGKEDAQAAKQLLEETTKTSANLADEMGVVNVSTQDVNKALTETGESAEKFNLHGREMHEVFHHLNAILPDLGTGLKALVNPEVGGLLLGIELFQQLTEHLKKMAEVQKAIRENQIDFYRIVTGADQLKEANDALAELADTADRAGHSVQNLITASEKLKQSTEDYTASINRQTQSQDALLKKQQEVALAKVRAAEALGAITPEQAAEQEAKIRGQSTQAESTAQRNAEIIEIDRLKQELSQQTEIQKNAKDHQVDNENATDHAQLNENFAKKSYDDAKSEVEKHSKFLADNIGQLTGEQYAHEQRVQDLLIKRELQAEDNYNAAREHTAAVKSSAGQMAKDMEEASKRIAELQRQIDQKTAELNNFDRLHRSLAEQQSEQNRYETITRITKGAGGVNGVFDNAQAAMDAGRAGQVLTNAQQQDVRNLNALLLALGDSRAQINAIIQALLAHTLSHADELKIINQALAQLGAQNSGSLNLQSQG